MKAAEIVGAKSVHFDIPDCIYRRGPDGEPLYVDIYAQPHEAESHLPGQIAQTIAPHLQPEDRIICQLGVGEHVDHVIVRQAVEQLNHPVMYTADVPYLFWKPEQLSPLVAGMKESQQAITEAGLNVWIEAVLAYESQIDALFDSTDKAREEIHAYYSKGGGLSTWE
jgi:hypothetical protein